MPEDIPAPDEDRPTAPVKLSDTLYRVPVNYVDDEGAYVDGVEVIRPGHPMWDEWTDWFASVVGARD